MKKFLILGNLNAVTYKEIFPLLRENKIWLGVNPKGGSRKGNIMGFIINDEVGYVPAWWYTNIDHNKRHIPLKLTKSYNATDYPLYDNYNGINVNKTVDIPMDYDGIMGVPITFLDKYCPEQFEIVGGFNGYKESDEENGLLCGTLTEYIDKNGKVKMWTGPTINKQTKYYRILIKSK